MTQAENDLWSNINNPNNDANMDDWADAHNPTSDSYLDDWADAHNPTSDSYLDMGHMDNDVNRNHYTGKLTVDMSKIGDIAL